MTIELQSLADVGGWPNLLSRLFRAEDLDADSAGAALSDILAGRAAPAVIGAFVAALRTKGETVDELVGLLGAMRAEGERVVIAPGAIDTCGTGGDRSGTINVSTIAAFIATGAGAVVCKHGGRAASSLAGSADVLEALGVMIELSPEGVARCIREAGIGFCFAPRFHPAMRHVGPVRSQLGVATIFNFLGPLANPASVERQVLGVGDPRMAEKMIGVLARQGSAHAIVCYGHDGLDELSTITTSTVYETLIDAHGRREQRMYEFDPRSLGIAAATIEDLRGGDAAHNALRVRAILAGEGGPQRDLVALNGAAALVVADLAPTLEDGYELALQSLQSGAALGALQRLVAASVSAHGDGLV
jgi:anthranilate phosphoribosyltransferase